jgi:lipopolysaccharide export LptBFGC system permease protein LptF
METLILIIASIVVTFLAVFFLAIIAALIIKRRENKANNWKTENDNFINSNLKTEIMTNYEIFIEKLKKEPMHPTMRKNIEDAALKLSKDQWQEGYNKSTEIWVKTSSVLTS